MRFEGIANCIGLAFGGENVVALAQDQWWHRQRGGQPFRREHAECRGHRSAAESQRRGVAAWKKGTGTEPAAFFRSFNIRGGSEPVPFFHSTYTV